MMRVTWDMLKPCRMQPRQLLRSIGNLEMLEIADCDLCCGSAGTYNIDQPQIAADLGRRKAARVAQTGLRRRRNREHRLHGPAAEVFS